MCTVLLHSALGFEISLHTPTDQSTLRPPRADHKAAARTTHMQGVSTPVLRQALSAPRPLIKRNPWGFTYANVSAREGHRLLRREGCRTPAWAPQRSSEGPSSRPPTGRAAREAE